MATLKLNIYRADDHAVIEKTYESDTFEIMFGTLEDFMQVIKFDQVKSKQQVAANALRAFGSLRPLLKDVFHGVTDDELNRTKVPELIPLFADIFEAAVNELSLVQGKNAGRA